jgi:branched-subunit amino acid ABC-type transport system permease component
MGAWLEYTINGLIVGNIYALLAVGLALIFGVSHLINFAHGSVYMIGAFVGWFCLTRLALPLPVAFAACGRCRARRALRRCSLRSASVSCSTSSRNWCSAPIPALYRLRCRTGRL